MRSYANFKIVFGFLSMVSAASVLSAEVLFTENFEAQPDWTSTKYSTEKSQKASAGAILPENWTELYQDTTWSPETGYPENHASLEILGSNSDKAIGGKSAVMWRESFSLGWRNWASDSQLLKYFGKDYNEMYVEFFIRFSPNFYGRDHASNFTSKIFRVGSWSGEGIAVSGFQGDLGPIFLWDYKKDDYGLRNMVSFRGGPYGENYEFNGEFPTYLSLNFSSSTKGQEAGGADPKLIDQVNGGYLVNKSGIIDHANVFGPGSEWTKVAFYVKMNSAPGAKDGVLRQYINGVRILNKENIPWVMENSQNRMVGWNYFAIGGNDYFQPYSNEQRFEDWYAIDNITVRTDIPTDLSGNIEAISPKSAPNPPQGLDVN